MSAHGDSSNRGKRPGTAGDQLARVCRYRFAASWYRRSSRTRSAGITAHPDNSWMTQIARNITDMDDGFLRGKRYGPTRKLSTGNRYFWQVSVNTPELRGY